MKDPALPPNQQLVAPGKWPVVGEKASRADAAPWRVDVTGLVAAPRGWTLDELRALAPVEQVVDVHCVTRWSQPGMRFGGIPLARLLEPCAPLPSARFVSFVARSERAHSTSLPLAEALDLGTLVTLTRDGEPLAPAHGGPVRTVVPGRYFYKSLKWLERIELLAEDRLGYWEAEAGYHNRADPWRDDH
jgi:DMSO/TMAO reductase YedYZ molybdopterin-dependent catalytic subunit